MKESFVKLTAVLLNKDEDRNEVRPRMDIFIHSQVYLLLEGDSQKKPPEVYRNGNT